MTSPTNPGFLQKWQQQEEAPSNPVGLTQTVGAAGGHATGDPNFADSALGRAAAEQGYVAQSQRWYTGANADGTGNGWDTAFYERMFGQQQALAKQGLLGEQFEQPDATGVVAWDHASKDGTKRFTFGDVYDKGKYEGNLYDIFDRPTADLMMGKLLFDGDKQRELFGSDDPTTALADAVKSQRDQNNIDIPKALEAKAFQEKVASRTEDLESNAPAEAAIVAGATGGGAALGAGIGTVIAPGIGTLIGGGIGAAVGLFGGLSNRDELTSAAARALEVVSLAGKQDGIGHQVTAGLSQWASFGGRLISPLSNTVHGLAEITTGGVGDARSAFYATTDTGARKMPGWVQGLDVAASVGDAAAQFASPLGAGLFQAQMGSQIAGGVGELALTGKSFDDRRGNFDSVFTDDHGNFDLASGLAGIGNIGIDAAQFGMARGLLGRTNAARAAVGEPAAYGTTARITGKLDSQLPLWLGGSKGLAEGERRVAHGGFSYTMGADGKIVEGSRRASLALLAPSEQLGALSTRVLAMRTAAKRGGAMTTDDFYRAAESLATGQKKIVAALVNGFGEGYEELTQAVLEPYSHDASPDANEMFQSFLYGAAMGAGMTIGANLRSPGTDARLYAQAQIAHRLRTGGEDLSRDEWNGMDATQKRALAAMSRVDSQVARAAFDRMSAEQATELNGGVVGAAKYVDAVRAQMASTLSRATERTDGAFVITQLEDAGSTDADGNLLPGSVPADAAAASAVQTARNLDNHLRGVAIQHEQLADETETLTGQLDPANPAFAQLSDEAKQDLQRRLTENQANLTITEATLRQGKVLMQTMDDFLAQVLDPAADEATVRAHVETINGFLRDAFHRRVDTDPDGAPLTDADKDGLARAVTALVARDPHDSAGSYQFLVPQVSAQLTLQSADNVLQVSHAILQSIRGDYDGDKVRPLNQLILDRNAFEAGRSGAFFLGAGSSVNIGAPKYEKYVVDYLAEAVSGNNAALAAFATHTLTKIGDAIKARYSADLDAQQRLDLDAVLATFYEAIHANSKDARAFLLDGLADKLGGYLTERGRGQLSNEWLWLDTLVVSSLQEFQEAYAAHRPTFHPTTGTAAPNVQTADVRTRRARRAATTGQTLGLEAAGDTMFRKFQKLHYGSYTAPVHTADGTFAEKSTLLEMARLYEAIGAGITARELDAVRAKDEITARVLTQLHRLALDARDSFDGQLNDQEAMVLVANLRVLDLDLDENGAPTSSGKQVSLAQMLLKLSVAKDRRDKDTIFESSPELQAKHARLRALATDPERAAEAFVEITASQQLFALVGNDADNMGPHLTVEQYVRQFASQDEAARSLTARALRDDAAYLGRGEKHDMPYDLSELRDGKVSAYRSLVDAILEAGNKRHAQQEARSQRVSEQFQQAHRRIQLALREFAGLAGRADGELEVATVARLVESNPDFARAVMALIPNATANAVFTETDGQVRMANWVYEMFTTSDAAAAEFLYRRNLWIAQWNALGSRAAVSEDDGDEQFAGRAYNRLNSRMLRVMYKLAKEPDNGALYAQFLSKLYDPNMTGAEFLRWANETPGIRGNQAPLTLWVDDVAEFDADKAAGGWTTALQGAELREAITTLRKSSERLVLSLSEEKTSLQADVQTLQAVKRVLKHDAEVAATGRSSMVLDAGDRDLHDALAAAIASAGQRYLALGPNAMVYQTIGAVRGFFGQAHTKGTNPDNVAPIGAFDAIRDALDYTTNFERLMASLTAVNLNAIGSNPGELARDSLRSMDETGRPVDWTAPTVAQMVSMLEDASTRPLARAALFPQAMERDGDGELRPRLLVGKTLRDFLNGATYRDMLPQHGRLSQDAALRYAALVEAEARKFGGHSSLQRMVNDLVIARTSAAVHELTTAELEYMTVTAYHEVVQALQAVASVAAVPSADPLANLRQLVKTNQRSLRTQRLLGVEGTEDAVLTDTALDEIVLTRKQELLDEIDELVSKGGTAPDAATRARIENEVKAAKADLAAFEQKLELLREDDQAARVRAMFAIPLDPAEAAGQKSKLLEYVASNWDLTQRASSIKPLLEKIASQFSDSGRQGQVQLTDKEWNELSRAVAAVYLDQVVSLTAPGVSVPPLPDLDGERAGDDRYYDTSFAYLVDPLLDPTSPLVQAARAIHLQARLLPGDRSDAEVIDVLGRTVLNHAKLGDWTSDIPRASIEANQRLDSAAAAPAISISGNSPKRQAVVSAATRRTFRLPDPTLLSTVTLDYGQLHGPLFDDVPMQLALPDGTGHTAEARPLAQLNNRFARTALVDYVDDAGVPAQLDLLVESRNLGRPWAGEDSVAASGYQEIHVERLRTALADAAARHGIDLQAARVTVDFFHPDSQPAGPDWFNNVYFEGTSFKLDADRHNSLNETLWFATGSLSPEGQAKALDASKLGVQALRTIQVTHSQEREAIEADWLVDLSKVLRAKTRTMLETDLGFGVLDPEFYNAVYKNLKLRHFVRTDSELLTAEQVIEMQRRGEDLPADAQLWIPTDDVLRTMLGEQGNQGLPVFSEAMLEFDPALVPTYRGVTEELLARVPGAISKDAVPLAETSAAARAFQQTLTVRPMLTDDERNSFDSRMRYIKATLDEGLTDRAQLTGFSTSANLHKVLGEGQRFFRAENIAFDWNEAGLPFIGPRNPGDAALSTMVLRELTATLDASQGALGRTGWIYREGGDARTVQGELSEVNLGSDKRPGLRVLPGDIVLVELASFNGNTELAQSRLKFLAGRGATIVLGGEDGAQADLRAELAEYLDELQYARVAGSKHVFAPLDTSSRYQNQSARESTLLAMKPVSKRNRVAILNVRGLPLQENSAWIRPNNERLGGIAVVHNLIPTDFLADFNVPATPAQVEAVRAHLRALDTAEGRAFLREQAGETGTDLDEAYDRLLQRFDSTAGGVLPATGDQFGKGDIIPLVDGRGRVLLYRHGYKAPMRDTAEELFARTLPDSLDAANVAVFPSKVESAATVHSGTVTRIQPRNGYGLEVELDVPLQVFGDKKVLEWNGMKYLLTPMPDSVHLPKQGFFGNWHVDMVGAADDAESKESFEGLIDNHRNAFAYFGVNFLPDVTEFFFPGKGNDVGAQRATRSYLDQVSQLPTISVSSAAQLIDQNRLGKEFTDLFGEFSHQQQAASGVDPTWLNRLNDQDSVPAQIARRVVVYLMTPGARPNDVLRSGGFNDTSTGLDGQSVLMPQLFTGSFDNTPLDSPLRLELNRRFNAQLTPRAADGTGYALRPDWTFEVHNADPGKNLFGKLQFAEAHSAGDNPVKNGMSFDPTERAAVSAHSAAIAYQAIGARTAHSHDLTEVRRFAEGEGVHRFERDKLDGGIWRMLTGVPKDDKSFAAWTAATPAEQARRDNARAEVVKYRQPLKTDDQYGWDDTLRKTYQDTAAKIAATLRLKPTQTGVVDFWVRQIMGQPYERVRIFDANGEPTGTELRGNMTGKAAVEAAKDVLWNVENHYLPTAGAEVPALHVLDLQLLYNANRNRVGSDRWSVRDGMDADYKLAESWSDWVDFSLGHTILDNGVDFRAGDDLLLNRVFDPIYLLAVDGMMHSYQNATRTMGPLPVSMDTLVARNLMDPDTNRLLVSISGEVNQLTFDPVMLDAARAGLDELIGGQRIGGRYKGQAAPASEVAKRRDARRRWRKENGVPIPVDRTMRSFRQNGAEFLDKGTTTNALMRILTNMRVSMALLNPALWVSMGPEMFVRASLDRAANMLTGQGTTGLTARLQAKVTANAKEGGLLEALGLEHSYTPEQLTRLNQLYRVLGQRNDFKGMVYRELNFLQQNMPGIGRAEKATAAMARFGSRVQDPTWGVSASTTARRYLEAALQHIMATPTETVVSVDTLINELATDPTWLKKRIPDAHDAGLAAIAQLRSLKMTPVSLALKGIYEPMATSSNSFVNTLGNVVFKLPLLFSGYAINVATTITGMQGVSDAVAMMLEGRKKGPNSMFGRIQAKLNGREFDPETDATFDMSTVLEGIDLSRSFIRGGLTHTGLFMFGLMAGGLGLSGEDEETKRRRRAASLQGAVFLYDPRRIENDFRNQDSIFLDWLPFGMDSWFRVTDESAPGGARSMGQLHWMMKQFISPVIGMEKFFETGDFGHVTAGFGDALGSFPLINSSMWSDAVHTANDLADMAGKEGQLGGPENLTGAAGFLTQAVGVYERMLFENSFVNMLYTSSDRYDRDPYALPMTDSNGNIQYDTSPAGPQPDSTDAMKPYVTADGQVKYGYLSRDAGSAARHALSENRFTMALVSSLFTGLGGSDYLRWNMPIKTRQIEKPTTTKAEAQADVLAAFQGTGGQPNLTSDEIASIIKKQYRDAGVYYDNTKVEAQAKQLAAKQGGALLSMTDQAGREALTTDGARAVFQGLYKGSVKLGDPSLRGIYISKDMRDAIQKEWMSELIQEGVDLGLDESKATSRMKRIWYGPIEDPSVQGLGDLLWSKDISYSDTLEYNQLNTTYVTGPDGRPWATGFTREGLMGALGLNPIKRAYVGQNAYNGSQAATGTDQVLNTFDRVNGLNTGLRALELRDESWQVPTDAEIADKMAKAITDAMSKSYTPTNPYTPGSSGSRYGGSYGGGRYGGGYGGGYSSGGYANFERMYTLPGGRVPYASTTPFINPSSVNVRRADVRRERVWSERGRLNQWQ